MYNTNRVASRNGSSASFNMASNNTAIAKEQKRKIIVNHIYKDLKTKEAYGSSRSPEY